MPRICEVDSCEREATGKAGKYCDECRSRARRKRQIYVPTPEIDALITKTWQGKAYQKKAALIVSKRTGWPWWAIKKRAMVLGVVRCRVKEAPWSEEELRILEQFAWMHPQSIQRKLRQYAGTVRTPTAIVLKRKRLRLLANMDGYSATSLAELLGVDSHVPMRWIKWGWLKAKRRGTERTEKQGGDTWWIRHDDVRAFVLAHPDEVDLAKADKLWMMDVLSNGAIGVKAHLGERERKAA